MDIHLGRVCHTGIYSVGRKEHKMKEQQIFCKLAEQRWGCVIDVGIVVFLVCVLLAVLR